ncbi:hypothetical protein ACQ4PT_027003 [Festuca glaucescens]
MEEVVVLIVGAGPVGLATAACLSQFSIPYVIVERESCSASLWRNRAYDRLKLHLAKEFCELPHMSYPIDAPTYIPKNQFVKYLDDYIERFNIQPKYLTAVESSTYDIDEKCWSIIACDIEKCTIVNYKAKFLVVASGDNSEDNIPVVPGLETFPGVAIHSSSYKSGISYTGRNVLVVGSGNSGMEIAYDLASHGANTSIVIRSPIHIMSKELIRLGMTLNGEDMLNSDGLPKKELEFQNHWEGANMVYCAGLGRRGLAGIALDAKNISSDIKSSIESMSG